LKNEYLITFLKFVSQKYQKHSKLLSLLFFTWKGKTSFIEKSIKICFIPVVFWVIICDTNFYDQCGNRTRWPMSCSVSFSLDLDPSIWEKMLVGNFLSDCNSHLKGWKTLINWNNVSITKVNISALVWISSLFCLRIESTVFNTFFRLMSPIFPWLRLSKRKYSYPSISDAIGSI